MSNDDADLFLDAMSDVTPLTKKAPDPIRKIHTNVTRSSHPVSNFIHPIKSYSFSTAPSQFIPPEKTMTFSRSGVSQKQLKLLQQGKVNIDDRLDLHGHTADGAGEYFHHFIDSAYAEQKRCLLIIHGKGKSQGENRAILKSLVYDWLTDDARVLAFCSSKPKDGGTGSVYVQLKKQRT